MDVSLSHMTTPLERGRYETGLSVAGLFTSAISISYIMYGLQIGIYIYIPRTNTSMMRDLPLVSMESVGRNEQFVSRKIIVVVRLADINTT